MTKTPHPERHGRRRRARTAFSAGGIYSDLLSRLPHDAVTLDFDGTDVRDVIKLLAAKAKINIIYGSDVDGTLTLHLNDVPFNEAFRTVLSMMQLSTYQVGDNVLRVITPAALAAQRTSASTITKVIPLNYAKATAVKTTIDAVRSAEGRTGSSSIDAQHELDHRHRVARRHARHREPDQPARPAPAPGAHRGQARRGRRHELC